MDQPLFLGDPVTGAGFRLAGFATVTPDDEAVTAEFLAALERAPLVAVSRDLAERISPSVLRDAIARADPPVSIVADVMGPPRSLSGQVRRALGVET
jgi:vacuolar-type H+-ATPase subunit F/Vma7